MYSKKIDSFKIKNSDSEFLVDITEDAAVPGQVTYIALFSDLDETEAYDDTFYVSFKTVEEADDYVYEYVKKHNMQFKITEIDRSLLCGSTLDAHGVEHVIEVRRRRYMRNFHLYSVTHIWGVSENGKICKDNHGYEEFTYGTYAEAKSKYDFICGSLNPKNM